ncbi:calcineurin-like phosphoesterase, partial [Achlya hypogyna]
MAELATLLARERAMIPTTHTTLTTINGDFLSASQAGEYYKGAHMIDILNHMHIDLSVFGNHEFDFGADVLADRVRESRFQWLGANVREKATGRPFAETPETLLLPLGPDGALTLGVFGVCTPETPQLSFPGDRVVFEELVATAERCVASLEAQGADVVLALTHVSLANDKLLARRVPRIDVIVGGHDHDPVTLYQGRTFIHKSGQNAMWLGRLDLTVAKRGAKVLVAPQWAMRLNRHLPPEPTVAALVAKYMARFASDDAVAAAARALA